MSVTVNNPNMAAVGTGGTLSVSVSTKDGNGIAPGDTIIAYSLSNGTHAASVTIQDSVNSTTFTQDKEQQIGATGTYAQASRYVVVNAIPDGATITLTPFASATITGLCVTVIRYSLGTIAQAFVSQSNAASTSQPAPALGAAPVRGSFVMTFDAALNSGTLTPGGSFTADSAASAAGATLANAYLTADGTGTFASTWTDSSSNQSATMTVAYTAASVGTPYLIARASAAAGANTLVATVGSPVGAASVANDALYAAVFLGSTANAPTTITDSKSHTWVQKGQIPASNGMSVYFYESLNAATALVAADTITATFNNTLHSKGLYVFGCAGMNHTADLDPTSPDSNSGTGTAISLTNGTDELANNNELIIGMITSGYKSGAINWPSDWTPIGPSFQLTTGAPFMSVGAKVVYSTNPVTVGPTLTNSAVWAGLLMCLTPDPPTGAAASVQITDGSPLPAATEGVPYQYQFHATGGIPGYTWTESGPMPAGLTLSPGSGGGSGPIVHVGANGGPTGSPGQSLSDFDSAQSLIGGGLLTAIKLFYGADLPADWSAVASSSSASAGVSPQAVVNKYPKVAPIICWNGPSGTAPSSPATIAKFCSSIPPGQTIIFAWQQEPENSSSGISAAQYKSGMAAIADAIHALHRPELIVCHNAVWGGYMPTGAGTTGNYIPAPFDGAKGVVDYYAIDVYQHQAGGSFNGATTWPTQGLANHSGFQNWLSKVKPLADPLGIPLGINEYGVDDTGTIAARTARIQADWNYIKAHCGPSGDGAVSAQSLLVWLYWWHSMAGSNTHYKFTDSATETLWKSITQAASASGAPTSGGLLSGTPGPASAGTYASIAVTAHDSNGVTGNKTFSLTVNSPSSLAFDSTSPLPSGTLNAPYSYQFLAHGGKAPLTFALHAGSVLPAGLALTSAGVLSGSNPSVAGTGTFSVDVTDANLVTVTAAFSLTISGGLSISTQALTPGTVGVQYLFTLATAGGTAPFSWGLAPDSGPLAPGLAIDPDLGTIGGDPTIPGAYPLDLQVTDAGGATATKQLTLTIAQTTGGLPPLGRRRFGGSMGDWVFSFVGDAVDRAAGVTVTFYDALTGGHQVTDLTTILGAPITSVVTDASGEIPEFYGPDPANTATVSAVELYADANGGLGPRRRMLASDMLDALVTLYAAAQRLGA